VSNFAQSSCVRALCFSGPISRAEKHRPQSKRESKIPDSETHGPFIEDEMTLRLRAVDLVHRSKTQSFSIASSA
jgi:hypothetical protein